MKLFTSEQIKNIENKAAEQGMSHRRMMENAGSAAARVIKDKYGVKNKRIAVVCGRGNNGGDGFVAARKLFDEGAEVNIILVSGLPQTEISTENLIKAREKGLPILNIEQHQNKAMLFIKTADMIVDCIFGTGFHGEPKGEAALMIKAVNMLNVPIVSVDMPSGANCDDGTVASVCVKANITVTFIAYKTGQFIYPAVDFIGELVLADIGLPNTVFETSETNENLIDTDEVKRLFSKRKRNSNKGDYGKALLIAGSYGMSGAAAIAGRASVLSGAGLTILAVPKSVYSIVGATLFEPIYKPMGETADGMFSLSSLNEILKQVAKASAVLIGCGMGVCLDTKEIVKKVVQKSKVPIVIDADGINCITSNINILRDTKAPIILTPHPGEMARLTGLAIAEVQAQRQKVAVDFAVEHHVILVLKGANTVIAFPDGSIYINNKGNAGMAVGGTGDMLAGMIVSFIASGLTAENATIAAVHLHSVAGDRVAKRYSERSLTPTEMLNELPALFLEIENSLK
jgi:hydroxyethylthiazole kinase-like uncharacterized protein yjeF